MKFFFSAINSYTLSHISCSFVPSIIFATTMAKTSSCLQLLLFFVFIFFFSCVCCSQVLQEITETAVYNVSASLQKSIDILAFDAETLNLERQQELQHFSNSSFTLKLYSRDTLDSSRFKSYRDLTLSRLQRDSARLSFIHQRLNLASGPGVTNASKFGPMDLESPLTFILQGTTGQYLARIGFGSPPQQLYIAIDTGSDVTWIQCAPCTPPHCYKQLDPLFNPSMSSSYKQLSCDSQPCKELELSGCYNGSNTCAYITGYADGSYTMGNFSTETLTFGSSTINDIAIGCGRENRGIFLGQAGILGLGRGSLSFPSQAKTSSFSYCFVDQDSTAASTLELGSIVIPKDAVTSPLLRNNRMPTFYYVGLTGVSVGGQMLPIPASAFELRPGGYGGSIVDSGTTVTRFVPEIYNVLRDEFVKGAGELPRAGGFDPFDTCYDLTSRPRVLLPGIALHFGDKSLNLPDKSLLAPVGTNVYCFAFGTFPSSSVIGIYQLEGIKISYDVGRSLVGFSPNEC